MLYWFNSNTFTDISSDNLINVGAIPGLIKLFDICLESIQLYIKKKIYMACLNLFQSTPFGTSHTFLSIHSILQNSLQSPLSTVILSLGKARNCREPNLFEEMWFILSILQQVHTATSAQNFFCSWCSLMV